MSALEEYEALDAVLVEGGGNGLYPKTVRAAIESLKCCGNCKNYDHFAPDWDHCQETCQEGATADEIAPSWYCHFTPSRWQERS